MRKLVFLLCVVGFSLSGFGTAQATTEDRASATFLLFQPSARSAGLGEAYVAIADDANATYYNPAGLADAIGGSLSTTYYKPIPKLANDIYTSFGAYTHSFEGLGNLGFSILYASEGSQEARNEQNVSQGIFSSYGLALGLSYGTHVTKSVSVGVTAKFIYEDLASGVQVGSERGKGYGTSFAGDFGFMWKPTSRFTLAWVLRNVGPNITFIDADQASPIQQNFTFGLAYEFFQRGNSSVLFTSDIYKPLADRGFTSFITGWSDSPPEEEFKDIDYRSGMEWLYNLTEGSAFALRAGYFHDHDGDRKTPTFGLGLKYNWASFDLSYFASRGSSPLRNVFRFSGGFSI